MENNISGQTEKFLNEIKYLKEQLKNKGSKIAFLESQNQRQEKRLSSYANEKQGMTKSQEQ